MRRAVVPVLLAIVLGAGRAAAQVNAEALRADPFRPGWGGSLDLSLSLLRGNVDLFEVGGGARVQKQTLFPAPEAELPFVRERLFLAGAGRFAERGGATFVNQSFLHLRWTRMWLRRLGADAFVQQQANEFQRLERRRVGGLGLRAELVHRRNLLLAGGTAWMLESERIDVGPGAPDPPETRSHRSTSYVTIRLDPVGGDLLVQATGYFQPRFGDLADHRLLGEVELQGRAGRRLSLTLVFTATHDSRPPTGVEPVDLRLVNALRLSF
jgi:hypothetical protein